ncbi:TetR/AcrR family transcriptional regulator [Nakamurella sp. GG22]
MTTRADVAERHDTAGLRERKKDATRRALAETAMDLAHQRGYHDVTIADITAAVGVSRRTFSNYFAGKAECVAAVAEGWFDDIALSISDAPADHPLDRILCDSLSRVAADLPERWERFFSLFHAEPELKAAVLASDEVNVRQLADAIADRCGLERGDIRARMIAAFGNLAGTACMEQWVLSGRPGGPQGFTDQLSLAFSIIDLRSLAAPDPTNS